MNKYPTRRKGKHLEEKLLTAFFTFCRDLYRLVLFIAKRRYRCTTCHKLAITKPKAHTVYLSQTGMIERKIGWYCKPCSRKVKTKGELVGFTS